MTKKQLKNRIAELESIIETLEAKEYESLSQLLKDYPIAILTRKQYHTFHMDYITNIFINGVQEQNVKSISYKAFSSDESVPQVELVK